MRILISGGGTGGHISPALAIIEELRRRDPDLLLRWIGKSGSMEERASQAAEVPFRAIPAAGWPRGKAPFRRLWVMFVMGIAALRAAGYVRSFRPQVVVGVGGYVSLPVLWIAQRMGVPTMIHEQNKRMGMTNRLLAPRATRVFLSFEATQGGYAPEAARTTGNPVRSGFITPPDKAEARQRLGLDSGVPVVLVSGGSQGARTLNRAMSGALAQFKKGEVHFLWMTGKADYIEAVTTAENCACSVSVFPYIEDMVTACAAADLIVSRAGASSTAEIAAMGKASLLIPFPHATDNHQEDNARAFEAAGAAEVLLDIECNPEVFESEIRALLQDHEKRQAMEHAARSLAKSLAAEAITEEIMIFVFQAAAES